MLIALTVTQIFKLGFYTDNEWSLLTLAYFHYDESKQCFVPYFDPAILSPFKLPHLFYEFGTNGIGLLPDLNLWKYYDSISVRTMPLRGKKSSILNYELVRDMFSRGPRPALTEFEGIGHAPSLPRSEQINALLSFLYP